MKLRVICIFLIHSLVLSGFQSNAKFNRDSHGRIKMGELSECDDGQSHLKMDWDVNDSEPYTCRGLKNLPTTLTEENKFFLNQPENYPDHACMTQALDYQEMYNDPIPSSGTHRPIWPVYGSYTYCPPQRWLHNLEHGAVVLLYHPCARPEIVAKMQKLVRACLRRHVITPNKDLPDDYPFAIITWRNKFYLNHFDETEIIDFIKKHGLHGRETTGRDGMYKAGLKHRAVYLPNSVNDSNICPNM